MRRSLRIRLAARVAAAVAASLALISVTGYLGARVFLDREITASLYNVAAIQASSVTDAPSGEMHFHEWDLTPEEAAQVRELNRFAQVWSAEGRSLLRTQYIREDLPLDRTALRAAATGQLITREQSFAGIPIRSLYYPLERLGPLHAHHVLQVAAPLTGRNRMLEQLAWLLASITMLAGAVAFAGGWWLSRRVVRPLHEIIDQAEAIRAGTLASRIEASADSQESERLVGVLNTMLARLEQSFEAQRRFTADASHELRSPLTALRGEIEVALRREREPEEYRRVLGANLQEVDRLSRLAEDLLTLARSDTGMMEARLEPVDLGQHVASLIERLRPRAEARRIVLSARGQTGIAPLDASLMDRLLWNLLDNALHFAPRGGRVDVRVKRYGDELELDVSDDGPGVPASDRERVFERFFRGDAARTATDAEGTGLGLSIARAIAIAHGGRIDITDSASGGARFRVCLPVHPPERSHGSAASRGHGVIVTVTPGPSPRMLMRDSAETGPVNTPSLYENT